MKALAIVDGPRVGGNNETLSSEMEEVREDREGMDTVWQLGLNIAWLADRIQAD